MMTMMMRRLYRCLLMLPSMTKTMGRLAHGVMVQTIDVRSFDMNNRALILTVLKVI